ncbi:two-component sensor histidine kinase [Dactylosporangium vinaceum]|uniref:histidine kinase n=1 Tax=Dactylosporangium vinaceum TaxID=53362 RepID=A0ABV5MSW6_9ACTN|nr:histidine kinase [Dactylosporangium vinaceum]UAB97669.1 two-component sensor histidine kinase [Dactylosporangium vinaceum]
MTFTWRPRDIAADIAVVALPAVLSAGVALDSALLRPYGGAAFAALVVVALSLLARRRAPLAVAWVSVVVTVIPAVAPAALVNDAAPANPVLWWAPTVPFAAYSVLAYADRRIHAWIAALALAAAPLLFSVAVGEGFGIAYRTALFTGGFAVFGMYVYTRRRLTQGLVERAERAERERHLLAEQARAEERARMAAEMHDVITHRVSLMVVQAGALSVATADEATRAAADELRAIGCQALEELRDAVHLLRSASAKPSDTVAEASADPPVPDLTALIAESESVGIPVELVEEGRAGLAAPVVSRTAYRVVQEALTNVRKHAPGATVRLSVRYAAQGVRLTVHNSPRTREVDDMLTAAGSGSGLLGLRERVELVNGTLRAESDGEGGFVVEAQLPTSGPAAQR